MIVLQAAFPQRSVEFLGNMHGCGIIMTKALTYFSQICRHTQPHQAAHGVVRQSQPTSVGPIRHGLHGKHAVALPGAHPRLLHGPKGQGARPEQPNASAASHGDDRGRAATAATAIPFPRDLGATAVWIAAFPVWGAAKAAP